MKKKPFDSIIKKLPSSTLYIDDIRNICTLFSEAYPEYTITLETDDYDYESLEELLQNENKEYIDSLKIKITKNNEMSLFRITYGGEYAISKGDLKFHIYDDDLKIYGVYEKLLDLIKNRRRFYFIKNDKAYIYINLIFYGVMILNFLFNTGKPVIFYSTAATSLIFFLTAGIADFKAKHSVIVLANREDKPSFFVRKKDEIILAAISGAIGAISGVVGTLLVMYIT